MQEILRIAGETALDTARQKAVEAEVFLLYNRALSIELRDAQVETLKEAEEIGLGVRILNHGRMGFAYSSDLSKQAILEVVDNAISISDCMSADEFHCLVEPTASYPVVTGYDEQIALMPLEAKIELARVCEKAARDYDKRIRLIEKAAYEDAESLTLIMNSKGLVAHWRENLGAIYIALVAQEDQDSQTGFAAMARRKIADLLPEQLGQEAASRAVRSLKAQSIASQRLPCVMEPYVVTRFMGLLLPSLQGDAVLKGKSMWAKKIAEQVTAPMINLIDDGGLEGGIASAPFDGEGFPSQRNVLIKDGCLQAYLYDNYSGRKAGLRSTGNGRRASFRSLPSVGSSNLMLSPGALSPVQLIGEIEYGLLITEVMGMHTANPISGDFSLGASGILIQAGKLTRAVRGITIAGNLHNLLNDIQALGSDVRFYGAKAAPSIRLNQLSIGGE
jgi:PmbA protein